MRRISEHRRIAVVGAGVSGLVAAAELHRAGHDVHVFEAGDYPGGHTNTIDVETPAGKLAVDTGFIVFNELNYPNFERMLAELGVASQPTDMSFSVSDGRGGFEWATTGPRGLFARPAHALDPRFHRMLRDLVRFNREARKLVGSGGARAVAPSLPSGRRLLGLLRRAAARPAGLGRVVGGPRADVEVSRGLPRPVLRQPSRSTTSGQALLAVDYGRVPTLRRGADRAVSRTGQPPRPGPARPPRVGWGGDRAR